jgi:phenylpyruvate tautomerase PptA (4-oxalocrotonate tautomerase family)
MAIVRVEIFKRSQEVREAIIKGITEVLVANGAKAEGTEVIIYEIEPTNWGRGGESFAKRFERAAQAEAGKQE